MIMHGMQDSIVLFKDSVQLAEKLMQVGKDFEFVVLPSAVHEWSVKDYNARYGMTRIVEFFDKYLKESKKE
jgi:dipeptidyl aminopeptidase/acylaminoacyl peptidase